MCIYLARGGMGGVGVRGLGWGFTKPVGTGGVCDVCGLRWCCVGVLGLGRWGGVMSVCCESGFFVWMACSGLRILC